MSKKHKPRSGSLAYYPRKRARKETPSFSTFPKAQSDKTKAVNFLGYKVAMTHAIARDAYPKSVTSKTSITIPCTLIECPPLKVFGARLYAEESGKKRVLGEIARKSDKHLSKKLPSLSKMKKEKSVEEFEKRKDALSDITLLVHTQPALTTMGKKKPDIAELTLTGSIEEKIAFAKEKLGKEVKVSEVFKEKQFVDVKAVSTGKGFQGPVKRFGVKDMGHKSQKHRVVGSIGPWHPATVMWTVARPGQMGYHTRTEYNKRIIMLSAHNGKVNHQAGFKDYGIIKNEFVMIAGSIPGPSKRAIALREPMRKVPGHKWVVEEPSFIESAKEVKARNQSASGWMARGQEKFNCQACSSRKLTTP